MNTPYSPFGRQDAFTPKISPGNTAKAVKGSAQPLQVFNQHSKGSNSKKITPG
jgi:hypothetical protein